MLLAGVLAYFWYQNTRIIQLRASVLCVRYMSLKRAQPDIRWGHFDAASRGVRDSATVWGKSTLGWRYDFVNDAADMWFDDGFGSSAWAFQLKPHIRIHLHVSRVCGLKAGVYILDSMRRRSHKIQKSGGAREGKAPKGALIALNIGRDAGILSAKLFSIMVVMALSTTLFTAPALNAVYIQDSKKLTTLAERPHQSAPREREKSAPLLERVSSGILN